MKTGRIVYAIGMLLFGLAHFAETDKFAALVPIPGAALWVYFTGVCLVAAAVSYFIKKQIALSSLLLGIMLLGFVVLVHAPQALATDEMVRGNAVAHVFKTLSLAGAAFFFYGYYKKA